ncbi:MAG TPA: hypothetical protein VKX49_14930 [Bryobacteraceae bacterium]|nr:hypothetical protein [Bryobacteraceae bacterium]
MKRFSLHATLVAGAFLALSTASWAGTITGTACISTLGSGLADVGSQSNFNTSCTGGNPVITFTTTSINFVDNTPAETFQTFFNSDPGAVSGIGGTLSASSSDNGSIWDFHGTGFNFSSSTTFSVTHDDGVQLYVDGTHLVIDAATPTAAETSTGSCGGFCTGNDSFDLYYSETNGSPAVLQFAPVPEPSQVSWLLFGVLGCALLLRRKFASQQ